MIAMNKATLGQAHQLLKLVNDKNVSVEQLEAALDSGLLSDVLDANFGDDIKRDAVRALLGLTPLNPPTPEPPPLLEQLELLLHTPPAERFDADAFFNRGNRQISFYDSGGNFASLVHELVETPVLPGRISGHRITRGCNGVDLVKTIGNGHDLQFADIAAVILKQPHGPKSPAGMLRTDGYWNVAKVGEWLVRWCWCGDGLGAGWYFYADRPGYYSFYAVYHAFLRDSA